MAGKEQLEKLREEIDGIDEQMIKLFTKRMRISDDIAEIKRENNISLVNAHREENVIKNAIETAYPGIEGEAVTFVRAVMALSKSRQRQKIYGTGNEFYFPKPREPITENVKLSYEGRKGGWCEGAARKFITGAEFLANDSFESVFIDVKDKKATYGVLPIENSSTGGVGEVHDLLRKYGCYIVGQTWVNRQYCLMANKGAGLDDIRTVYAHPKAIEACAKFIKGRPWELVACNDAATAAEKVANSGDVKVAAIGPIRAAEVYSLAVLTPEIEANTDEKIRYILIADTPEYDETCDTVSIMFRTAHRSGALIDTLFPMMSENINLKRLESRPVSDGKYCFFCDMEGNIKDESVEIALRNAAASCGYLEILGCYSDSTQTRYLV